jgi:hypothetical protein
MFYCSELNGRVFKMRATLLFLTQTHLKFEINISMMAGNVAAKNKGMLHQ